MCMSQGRKLCLNKILAYKIMHRKEERGYFVYGPIFTTAREKDNRYYLKNVIYKANNIGKPSNYETVYGFSGCTSLEDISVMYRRIMSGNHNYRIWTFSMPINDFKHDFKIVQVEISGQIYEETNTIFNIFSNHIEGEFMTVLGEVEPLAI